MAGVYLHVPFCKQACHYCDFYFSTNQEFRGRVVEAMVRELEIRAPYLSGQTISTIYFGGGTPSILSVEELTVLLNGIRNNYSVDKNPEITLEANPDDLELVKLKQWRALGINRLSIGIQTFHNPFLEYMNRAHDSATALTTFEKARSAGFANISIDLIYAIPGQTDELWLTDIRQAIALQPEHISCYSLTIEPRTVFGNWHKQGKLRVTEDDTAAHQLEMLVEHLGVAGYEHYEVSNFAKPGFYSKHNSSYWKSDHYLGIGPSAHSYNGMSRQYNVSNNHAYLQSVEADKVPAEIEVLSVADKINEYILVTLRTHWGCDTRFIKKQFQYDLLSEHSVYIDSLLKNGYASIKDETILLSKSGKLLADKIASDLFLDT